MRRRTGVRLIGYDPATEERRTLSSYISVSASEVARRDISDATCVVFLSVMHLICLPSRLIVIMTILS